ncbi:unnamed protein product, partial [Trichogramma brassicae]
TIDELTAGSRRRVTRRRTLGDGHEVGRPRSRPASPGGAASSNSNSVGAQEIAELRAAIVQLTEITRDEALQRRDQPRGRSSLEKLNHARSHDLASPTPHRGSTEGTAGTTRDTATWQSSAEARACVSHPKARQEKLGVPDPSLGARGPSISMTIERRLYVTDRTHKDPFPHRLWLGPLDLAAYSRSAPRRDGHDRRLPGATSNRHVRTARLCPPSAPRRRSTRSREGRIQEAARSGHHQAFIEPVGQSIAPRAEAWKHLEDHGDYRLLNARTQPDRHPLPIIEDLLQESVGKVFSVVDLYKAFYQIPVAEEDISKTAVTTPFGLFEFVGMPLGLRNSAQTFQRTMNYLLRDLDFVRCYQDDILVLSASHEQHLQHLRELLTILKRARAVRQLGEVPDRTLGGRFRRLPHLRARIRATSSKVEAIARFPKPSDSTQLRRFIGMLNFYRRCLPHAAELMSPLTDLLRGLQKKKEKLACSAQADEAFERIKQAMASAVRSAFYHPGQPLALHTDASNTAIGAAFESAPRRRRLDAAGFLLAEVITNSAEVLNVRSRAAGHLRGDQIFSEDTRGSKLHHHDRSSPSVLRPRAEVGQVLASTVTSARLHLALRCQDRLHARRREPSGRRSISHRRDYDANDAQLGPNQRGTAEGRTTNTSPRQGETQASRRRDRRTFPCLRRAAKRPEAIPTRESTSTGFRHGSHSLSSERQSYREASRAAILLAVDEQGHPSPVRLQGPGNERLRVSSARHHSQAARAAVYRTTQSHPPHQRAKLCRRRKWRRQDALYRSAQASLPGCRRQRSITGNTGAANYHAAFINTESHFFTPCANCPVH